MIRIGIDATAIPLIKVGAGNYTFNLIKALAKTDAINEYVIFAKTAHINEWHFSGTNIRCIPCDFTLRPIRILWEQLILPLHVSRLKIDVLHSPHYTMPFLAKCRRIVTFHDLSFQLFPKVHDSKKRFFFSAFMKKAIRHADAIIAVSQSTKNDIIQQYKCDASKVTAIAEAVAGFYTPNVISPLDYQICSKYGIKHQNFILNVGVLQPRKNISGLIDAYHQLRAKGVTFPLLIVGRKGWDYHEIFTKVKTLKLSDHILFPGYVPEDDMPSLYRSAICFVYPSIYEGFGLPLLESISCGTPVICSNISSMPEVVGNAGILIPPNDTEFLAQALHQLTTDEHLRMQLRERCSHQAQMFSWEQTARLTRTLYKQIARLQP